MHFTQTTLNGTYIIDIEPIEDERGYFARSFCSDEFLKHGLHSDFVQHNISYNLKQGTIRGMHYQLPPYEEIKVVRCIKGTIFDVIVDLRPDSATYMQWFSVELSEDNARAIYIPKGFAHGFQSTTDNTIVLYLMSEFYHRGFEAGLRWDDERLDIKWPILNDIVISDRDSSLVYI